MAQKLVLKEETEQGTVQVLHKQFITASHMCTHLDHNSQLFICNDIIDIIAPFTTKLYLSNASKADKSTHSTLSQAHTQNKYIALDECGIIKYKLVEMWSMRVHFQEWRIWKPTHT